MSNSVKIGFEASWFPGNLSVWKEWDRTGQGCDVQLMCSMGDFKNNSKKKYSNQNRLWGNNARSRSSSPHEINQRSIPLFSKSFSMHRPFVTCHTSQWHCCVSCHAHFCHLKSHTWAALCRRCSVQYMKTNAAYGWVVVAAVLCDLWEKGLESL